MVLEIMYAKKKIIVLTIIFTLTASSFFFGSIYLGTFEADAGTAGPPINGTTNNFWYVDGMIIRDNEQFTTSDIQINDSAKMTWDNIVAEVKGNITVNSTGYFNLTDSIVTLSGNLTIKGTATFRNVTLKMNSTYQGQFHVEVIGALYIYDSDSTNSTSTDASFITAYNTNFVYLFWVREFAGFVMKYSEMNYCGYAGAPFNANQYGMFIQANNTHIANNTITNNERGVFYYHSNSNYLANNTISTNTDGVNLEYASYNTIYNNVISNNIDDGIELVYSPNNTIEGNTISGNGDDGVDIDSGCNYNLVVNNTISNNPYGTMITNAVGNVVKGNTFMSNSESNIGLYSGSTGNYILNNFVSGGDVGIGSLQADGNHFEGNTVQSTLSGFGFDQSSNNTIVHNIIKSNNLFGITLRTGSKNNYAHYNNITGNFLNGIRVLDSTSNINATHNWWGHSTGPFHSSQNPGGQGDRVTNNVIFDPWLKKRVEEINPDINTTDNTTAVEDSYYEVVYNSVDADVGDVLTWRKTDNTTWLKWGSNNRTLYGTPDNSHVGTFWVAINVTYGYGGTDEHNFTLIVLNIEPVITTIDLNSTNEDEFYIRDYNSTDDGQGNVTWILDTNASWLSINNSGVLKGTPGSLDIGTFWVNVTVDDGNGGSDFHNFTLTVINKNDAPQIETTDLTTIEEDSHYKVTYTAVDADPGDTITWTFGTNASWLNWGPVNHTVYGTPGNIDVGSYWVRINVTDGNGGYDEHFFNLVVINQNDKPYIATSDQTSVDEDSFYEVIYTAVDIDPGDILTWTFNTNASWLNWGPSNHTLFGTPKNDNVGSFWVRINVTDNQGGYDEHYFDLEVKNTNDAPVIEIVEDIIAPEDEYLEVSFEASDVDPGDELVWSVESTADWLSWGESNHTIFGTPRNEDVGSYTVKIAVNDDNGGSDDIDFNIDVQNVNDPPTITGAPGELLAKPNEDIILDLTDYVDDVDNETSDLSLIVESDFTEVNGLIITFNYPEQVTKEDVEVYVSDGIALSNPHNILVTIESLPSKIIYPEVTEHFPEGKNVPVDTNISLTFNKNMDQASVRDALIILPEMKFDVYWLELKLTINPITNLEFNATYTVSLGDGAVDLEGNNIQDAYSWEFITELKDKEFNQSDPDLDPDDDIIDDNGGDTNQTIDDSDTDPLINNTTDGKPPGDDESPQNPSESEQVKPNEKTQGNSWIYSIIITFITIGIITIAFVLIKQKRRGEVANNEQFSEEVIEAHALDEKLDPAGPKNE
jgi:parallel beta-helix repeat protein